MSTIVDIEEEVDVAMNQDDLTPEQRAYWEASIERDMRDIAEGKPHKYISGDEFKKNMIDALHKNYSTIKSK